MFLAAATSDKGALKLLPRAVLKGEELHADVEDLSQYFIVTVS